jgi:hypothetical protein
MCNGHGTCDTNPNGTGACICNAGFGGPYCDMCTPTPPYYDYPVCRYCVASTTCNGHGTCDPASGACSCAAGFDPATNCQSCAAGYFGPNCQQCAGNPACSGPTHGSCSAINNAPQCTCINGYVGNACQFSNATTCDNRGTVVLTQGGSAASCSCLPPYGAADCSICAASYYPFNGDCRFCQVGGPGANCGSGHCDPTGLCTCNTGFAFGNASDPVHCTTCLPNYYGPSCVFCNDVATCNAQNGGGVCNPAGVPNQCTCNAGFSGAGCQIPPACPANFCQNNGLCQTSPNGTHTCTCTGLFYGDHCEKTDSVGTPRAECVDSDPSNPGMNIVVFGYERPTDVNSVSATAGDVTNQVLVNGASVHDVGQPSFLSVGLHRNVFAVRYNPATDVVTWTLFGATASSASVTDRCSNPAGPQGPVGPLGAAGADGERGARGATGPTGPTGVAGPSGATGSTGAQGSAGSNGAQGSRGTQGPLGVIGAAGATGAQGTPGAQGGIGAVGPTGSVGAGGATGAQGNTGAQGAAGDPGAVGGQGVQGILGAQGVSGPQGATGTQGLNISFVGVDVSASGTLSLPPGNASAVYLVRFPAAGGPQPTMDLTLPPAASAPTRGVTVRLADGRGTVLVHGAHDGEAITLNAKVTYVTLVSDGSNWFVIAGGR